MTTGERAAIPVMAPGRGDVIVAGAVILVAVMGRFGFDERSCPRPTSSTGSCSRCSSSPDVRSIVDLSSAGQVPCLGRPKYRLSAVAG